MTPPRAQPPGRGARPSARRSISFVLPAFNEAANIERAIGRCLAVGEHLGLLFEVIVVDDGSHDETRRLASAADPERGRVRTLHHPCNRGYGAALKTGLLAARMDRVFFTDADLQFEVGELERLLAWADDYDIVAGYRAPRRDPLVRRINGWAWSRLMGMLFDLGVRDVDCAFKLFDRRIFDRVPLQSIGAFVNTEILARARAEGFTLLEVPVSHHPRVAGQPTGGKLRVIARAFRELAALHAELRRARSSLPSPADRALGGAPVRASAGGR